MFSCEYCEIFNNNFFIDHLVNSFTKSQKEMAQLSRRLNILSQLNLHLTCQYDAQKQHSQKPYFFSVDFLDVIIYQNFLLLIRKDINFNFVNPLLFLLPFIIFFVLLSFSMISKFNFGWNF